MSTPDTSVATARPMHPDEDLFDPEDWYACSQPERPADENCVYEERCAKCILKAQVDLAAGADDDDLCDVQTGEPATISGMIADFYEGRAGSE